MLVVFLTAVPITVFRPNLFLFLIAVFSFHLVATGWLRARNPDGAATAGDRIAVTVMGATAIAMAATGLARLRGPGPRRHRARRLRSDRRESFALADLSALRRRSYRGRARVAAHLPRMLAGTIAAVTAFTVVNVSTEPAVLAWLGPTAIITPLIVYWNRRVLDARSAITPDGTAGFRAG
jgi:hypothetical protein